MSHASGTPLLVRPDLLGSTAGARALDEVVREGTGCKDEGMVVGDEGSGTCTREHDEGALGCTCGGIGLVGGDSCGVAIGEGTSDRGARGEAGGEGSMDQSERRIGESGGDCHGEEMGDTLGEESSVFIAGAVLPR